MDVLAFGGSLSSAPPSASRGPHPGWIPVTGRMSFPKLCRFGRAVFWSNTPQAREKEPFWEALTRLLSGDVPLLLKNRRWPPRGDVRVPWRLTLCVHCRHDRTRGISADCCNQSRSMVRDADVPDRWVGSTGAVMDSGASLPDLTRTKPADSEPTSCRPGIPATIETVTRVLDPKGHKWIYRRRRNGLTSSCGRRCSGGSAV
jgi:hypothetical protein